MRTSIDTTGFRAPTRRPLGKERRSVMLAELVATLALALSTVVAATVLTVGIARAHALGGVIDHGDSLLGAALLFAPIFIGIGGFAAGRGGKRR
jgi:hypothetical protein